MRISDARLSGLRRGVAVGLLSMGIIVGGAAGPGVANGDCTGSEGGVGKCPALVASPHGAPPTADLQPSTMRRICATSACFLITDMPRAGVGGKT